jgi:hypothetical protein
MTPWESYTQTLEMINQGAMIKTTIPTAVLYIGWLASFSLGLTAQSQVPAGNSSVDHITLRNEHIEVVLSTPSSSDNYRGTRFDRSGIFHKIEFKGHSLCERWHSGPLNVSANDDVIGPCEEFGNERPLGYQPNQPGSTFLKIGVGKLVQPKEEKYRFSFPYPIAEEGKWSTQANKDSITFKQSLHDGEKIGYSYEKRVSLLNNGLEIYHALTNTGSQEWTTDHYNHNFFLVDSDAVGPNYQIDFPFHTQPTREQALFKELIQLDGTRMGFKKELAKGESYFAELQGHSKKVSDHQFAIRHKKSGVVIKCQGDMPLYKLNVWGMRNTICPEPYVQIQLKPSEKATWSLKYEFAIEP